MGPEQQEYQRQEMRRRELQERPGRFYAETLSRFSRNETTLKAIDVTIGTGRTSATAKPSSTTVAQTPSAAAIRLTLRNGLRTQALEVQAG